MIWKEFDVQDYLTDEEAIELYLQAAKEEGDPKGMQRAVKDAKNARERLAKRAALDSADEGKKSASNDTEKPLRRRHPRPHG